jgi:hypothetical protein
MSWKRKPINTEQEKEIITGMIVDDTFLRDIQAIYHTELLQTPFARIVGRWCIDYYGKYQQSPKSAIQEIYNSYSSSKRADETQIELIGNFLNALSENYEKSKRFNHKYALDKAETYFKTRQLELLRDKLGTDIINGKVAEAEKKVATFRRIERPASIGIDILKDNISKYLYEEDDELFTFPGALGQMIGPLCREDFVGITAPMKRGKTFWLTEFGIKGAIRGFKVIFYSMEMAYKKMIMRMYQNFLGQSKNKCEEIEMPHFTRDNSIDYKFVNKEGVYSIDLVKKKKQLDRLFGSGQFRLVCEPTGSMNVQDIKTHLDNLEHYNNFIPDMVIVDYADILAPEPYSSKEERHKLNETWKALRSLAQERKVLVVTGSQSIKATFNRDIDQGDVAEDIRKMAHVTTMLALNQTKDDKKKQVMRVGMLAVRDEEFHIDNEVIVLQCLKIGKPILFSRWKKDVRGLKEE